MKGCAEHEVHRVGVYPVDVTELVGVIQTGERIFVIGFQMEFERTENYSQSASAYHSVVVALVILVESAFPVCGETVSSVGAQVDKKPEA